jgi:hypothetical protein
MTGELDLDSVTPGETAYKAYGQVTGGLNYQGQPMPEWDALPLKIRQAWEAAAEAAVRNWGRE